MYKFYPKSKARIPLRAIQGLRIMKTIIILSIFTILQASAATLAQNITLSEKNVSLKKVFLDINKLTGYDFLASNSVLKESKPVTIDVRNQPLKSVLDDIFADQPLQYTLQDKIVIVAHKPEANPSGIKTAAIPLTIAGKIVDSLGNPLPGATLKNLSTSITYTADGDGLFTIKANPGDDVLASFIGYKAITFRISAAQSFLTIRLTPLISKLTEVSIVSTGYQTLPQERATGSFTQINKSLFNQQVSTDVLGRLEGITNGLSVFHNDGTRSSQVMIRGLSTINGPTAPLIVVDNFPYEGDLNNLNPNDVESVTVLKDAAAASIWGTRAGNGVIVINTKKGRYDQPLAIEFNTSLTTGSKPDLNYLTPMSSGDYIDFEKMLFSNGYYDNALSSPQYPLVSPVVQLLANHRSGKITSQQLNGSLASLAGNDVRADFSKFFYKPVFNQQYHINVSGGNTRLAYLFAAGYDHNNDNLAAGYDRLNLRSQASFKPAKGLQLTTALTYTGSNARTGRPAYGSINPLQPYTQLADASGSALAIGQTYNQGFKDNAALSGNYLNWNYYPLTDYQHNYQTAVINDITANFGASYQIFSGLSVDVKYQYEKQLIQRDYTYDADSYYARNLINTYSAVSGSSVNRNIPVGGISDQNPSNLTSHDIRGQINYLKDWDKNSISILAGEELRQDINSFNTVREYGVNADNLTTAPVDYIHFFPNAVTQDQATIPYINSLGKTTQRFVSFFANGSYTYEGKYTVSASMRRDGSNLFGVNTNDRWKPLWSTGVSWDIGKEKFYHFDAVPYLKIRGTLGYSGNVDPSKSGVTTISYAGTSIYTNSPYAEISNFANPDLRWEKTRTINLGVDFRSKNNRVSGTIDYYTKYATDLYATVPVDYTAGLNIATVTRNVGAMKSHGIDVELNGKVLDNEFKWQTTLIYNYYLDKVVNYYLTSNSGFYYVTDAQTTVPGYPVWSVYSYKSAGLDNKGNPQGYLNGQLSEDYANLTGSGTTANDLKYNGPRFPTSFGSWGNTFSYKNFSLITRITYNFGGYFRRQSINYSLLATTGIGNADYARRWQMAGDEQKTMVPAMVYPLVSARDNFYTGSESLIERSDCIRLQYVTLSYNLSKENFKSLALKSAQVFVNAANLGILWRANKYGIDPDYTYTNTTMPAPLTLSAGIKASL